MTGGGRLNLSGQRLDLLRSMLKAEGIEREVQVAVRPRPDRLAAAPLTHSQRRMWFLDHLSGGGPAYVISVALRLLGGFDLAVLAQAVQEVVRRHESLRTVFTERDGQTFQQVIEDMAADVRIVDLRGTDPESALTVIRTRHDELIAEGFDISTGPLLRVELLDFGDHGAAALLSTHHIVSDLWSMGVLMREVLGLYHSFAVGEPSALPPLEIQFPDFAVWQQAQPDPGQAGLDYWAARLGGAPAEIGLVTDRLRPMEKSSAGAAIGLRLPPGLVAKARALARAENATMFMVLGAAFTALLLRLSGTEDVVIGTPVANRPLPELEPLIGFFVNTLVLRTDASGNPSFRELLHRFKRVCLEGYEHQGVPFERVVDRLQPERSLSRTPIFNVEFAYQNAPFPKLTHGQLVVEPVPMELTATKFDLTLNLYEEGEQVAGRLEYCTDLFEPERAKAMAQYLIRLLDGLVTDPSQPILLVPLLDEAERNELLALGTGAAVDLPAAGGLHELVAAQAAERPDALAVVSGGSAVSYAELDRRSSQLAHYLGAAGVRAESVVGLCLPRGIDLITAILATWRAGAAYLPLDPALPAERLAFMMRDSGVDVLVTTGELGAGLPAVRTAIIVDDPAVSRRLGASPVGPPAVEVTPDDLAYVIYTSGSTGTPKGVQVTHRGLLSYVSTVPGRTGLGAPGARYALLQATFTDLGNTILFTSLVTGGELHILGEDAVTDPAAVAGYLARHQIDYVKVVPSHLAGLATGSPLTALIPARTLMLGGEAISPQQAGDLLAAAGDRWIVNHYGPTESTIGVATVRLAPEHLRGTTVPIGTPIGGARLYVLDQQLNLVPKGVTGELFVGGAGLARGYANRPELTAEKFIADPFAADGARMYRTGDRVRWRDDGLIEYLGRTDHQLKVRGYRIEPGEIEAVLATDHAVGRAVVLAREDAQGNKQLVAYVTPAPGYRQDAAELDQARLRGVVGQTLPGYMVPAAVIALDQLPLTANGKVNRNLLPAPRFTAATWRLPGTPEEQALAAVFAQVLGVSQVGVEDGFFDLGGDSIQAIQLVSRAREAGLAISTRDVFVHQTVTGLLEAARQAQDSATELDGELAAIAAQVGIGVVGPTPITEWLREFGRPIDEFSQTVLVPVPPETDQQTLTQALQAVLDHHDALRASLIAGPDERWELRTEPAGVVDAAGCLRRVDAADLDGPEVGRVLAEESTAARRRLDPAGGVMVQAVWLDAGSAEPGWLLLVIHHLVVDGVSWRVLLPDLEAAWNAIKAGRQVRLAPVGTSLRGWAALLAAQAADPSRLAELPTWRDALSQVRPLATGRHDPNERHGRLVVTLPATRTEPLLGQVPARFGAGVGDILLAGLGLALTGWRRDRAMQPSGLVVNVEGHGRVEDIAPGVDLTRTVGWFTSIHPVVIDPGPISWPQVAGGGAAVRDAVYRVLAGLDEMPPDGLGYGLLRYLNPDTAAGLAPLPEPQLAFNYLGRIAASGGAWQPVTDFAEQVAGGDSAALSFLPHPLEVNAFSYDGGTGAELTATWTWAPGMLDEHEVRALAERWFAALAAITACSEEIGDPRRTERRRRPGRGAAGIPIGPADRTSPVPLSFAQIETVLKPVGPDSPHHNVIAATVLAGPLDEAALRRALDGIAQRHEALRTRIAGPAPDWTQFVDPALGWPVTVVDLRADEEPARTGKLRDVVAAQEDTPFDIGAGPLARATLVKLAPEESVLLLAVHHIVIDPWGYGQLLSELADLYGAGTTGRALRLPELTIQYPDYAAWQQRRLAEGELDDHVTYWAGVLKDLPAAPEFDAPAHQLTESMPGFTRGVIFSEDFTTALKNTARRSGSTLFMLLMSGYQALLSAYSDSDDIAVSFPVAGREQPETKHLIGNFINIVVVRTDQSRAVTFADLLAQVRDGTLLGHAHQEVPLRSLHQVSDVGYDPFRIEFNLVNYAPFPLDLPGVRSSHLTNLHDGHDDVVIPEMVTAMKPHNLDIYLAMHERDGKLRGLWLYSPERIDPKVMAAMTRGWRVLLELVVADPRIPLAELRRQVLAAAT